MAWLRRWRNLWRRDRLAKEIDEELRSHIEMRARDNVAEGMTPAEAHEDAQRRFGNRMLLQERTRAMDLAGWVETLGQDLRFAVRMLRKSPGFTGVAVLTLALGIGANTSVFTLIYALAIRPLPVKDASSLVSIYHHFRGNPHARGVQDLPYYISYPEYANYRDGSRSFSGLAAYAETTLSLGGADPQSLPGLLVSCNYFEVLGAHFAAGRGFRSFDCLASASPVAVLSNSFRQREFVGDGEVIGKTLTLDSQVFTVIGVAGPEFSGTELQVPDAWVPLAMAP